jgi:HEAT repeat protein
MQMTDTLEDLLQQLQSDDLHGSISAGIVLGQYGQAAVEPLIALLQDNAQANRWHSIVDALGRIGDKRAVEPMIQLLQNPISFEAILARKYTAYALAKLADPRAVDVLIEMLHEHDHYEEEEDDGTITVYDEVAVETIEAAAEALIQIGEWRGVEAVVDRLLEGDFWFDHGVIGWGGQKEQVWQKLFDSFQSADPNRRARAASLIGELWDRRATDALISLLQNDPNEEVRHSAAYGLSEIRDPKAFLPLMRALNDSYDQVRLYAGMGINALLNPGRLFVQEGDPLVPTLLQSILDGMEADDPDRERVERYLRQYLSKNPPPNL